MLSNIFKLLKQVALTAIDEAPDAELYTHLVERLADKVPCAKLKAGLFVVFSLIRGKDEHGNIPVPGIRPQNAEERKPIHHRHDEVEQNTRNFTAVLFEHPDAVLPVFSLKNVIGVRKQFGKQGPVQQIVVNNEDCVLQKHPVVTSAQNICQSFSNGKPPCIFLYCSQGTPGIRQTS